MPEDIKNKIKAEYLSGVPPKKLSEKYNTSLNTIKSWIKRYGWSKLKNGGAPSKDGGAPSNSSRDAPKKRKRGGQPGNHNATGPPGNKNAEKHGFYSKHLPEETAEIINHIDSMDPLDVLWDNIQIQFAAIIRAQKLMYVRDQQDKTVEHTGEFENGDTYDVQQAWDKQASFLSAQSRAMSSLSSMIRQYDAMLKANSEIATEEQRARIDKIKAQTVSITGDQNEEIEDDGFLEALKGQVDEVWQE